MEHEGDDFTNREGCIRYSFLRIIQETGGL